MDIEFPPAEIRTPRLLSRQPRLDDADAGWASDAEVTRYLSWRTHRDRSETSAFLVRCIAAWEAGEGHRPWVIELDGRAIGMIGSTIEGHRVNIGYGLARSHWGRGLMVEAARGVVDAAFGDPRIHRVWAVTDVDNRRSARVLEKVGMTHEGVLRRWTVHPNISPDPRDCLCYSIVRRPA